MMNLRKALNSLLEKYRADSYIILSESDVRYFSGIVSSNIALLITKDGFYVISDSRYKYRIEAQSEFIPVVCKKNIYEEIRKIADEKKLSAILIDPAHLSYGVYLKYFFDISGKLILESDITTGLRSVKSGYETESIKKAQQISEKALFDILPSISEGMTTAEISAKLEYAMKLCGSEEPAFETIVLTGEGTADCHGIPDNSKVKEGDFILFDFGATVNGYRSDMTRTFAFRSASEKQKAIYALVLKAHYEAAAKIKSGIFASEVDKAARDVIENAGCADYFLHSTGHGVGLDIHEYPNVTAKSSALLENDMIITVEPGIYFKNEFGVRIEDMYIVKENEGVSLAGAEKNLIILK